MLVEKIRKTFNVKLDKGEIWDQDMNFAQLADTLVTAVPWQKQHRYTMQHLIVQAY